MSTSNQSIGSVMAAISMATSMGVHSYSVTGGLSLVHPERPDDVVTIPHTEPDPFNAILEAATLLANRAKRGGPCIFDAEDFRIWWTDDRMCDHIVGNTSFYTGTPEYITTEFASRSGRNGRGRLWVHHTLPDEIQVKPWPSTPLATWIGKWCGGTVIRAEHVGWLSELPGVITDLNLNVHVPEIP